MFKKILKYHSIVSFAFILAISPLASAGEMQTVIPPASGLSLQVPRPEIPEPGTVAGTVGLGNDGAQYHSLGTLPVQDILPKAGAKTSGLQGAVPAVNSSGIHYVTGGIGDEERSALEAMEKDYNLKVISADKSGAFTGIDQISIIDDKGKELLSIESGPILLVNLPKGVYTLSAVNGGESKKERVTIDGKTAVIRVMW